MAKNHHNVYVVELDDAVFRDKAFVEASPDYDPFLTPMYVGMTGLNPKERFKNHKRGYKANKYPAAIPLLMRKLEKKNRLSVLLRLEADKQHLQRPETSCNHPCIFNH